VLLDVQGAKSAALDEDARSLGGLFGEKSALASETVVKTMGELSARDVQNSVAVLEPPVGEVAYAPYVWPPRRVRGTK
jgi:hypothetical protein